MSIQPLPSIAPARSIYFSEVLMARASITPQDAGCQSYLIYKLEKLGFFCEKYTINGEDLMKKLKNLKNVNYKKSIKEAINSIDLKDNDIIIITGSLYLAGEALNLN